MALQEPSYPQEVGRRVRALREAQGWSQEKLAREADVSTGTVVKTETGRTWISENTGVALALALGVSVRYLMTGQGLDDPAPGEDIAYLPQEGSDLLLPSRPKDRTQSNDELRALAMAG